MRIPKRKSEQNRRYGPQDNYVSPERLQEMKDELEKLKKRVRPKVVEDLTAAREMGDLSENAAYSHAKGRLSGIDRRIFELREKIKNAVVIERDGPSDQVEIGSAVTVLVNGKERTFEITGSQETDPSSGRISHGSPVGQALMGRSKGESVEIKLDDRLVNYEITEIR